MEFFKRMMVLAIPIAMQNMLASCGNLVDTAMVVKLGNVATAAVGVGGRWTFLMNLILFGFCSGSAALISQFWGAKDHESIHKTYSIAMICALTLAVIYNAVAFLFPHQLMSVFSNELAVINAGAEYLKIVAWGSVPMTFTLVMSAARRATEDVNLPLLVSIAGVLTNTGLNYTLIYGHFGAPAMGLRGAAIATLTSLIVQALLLIAVALRQHHFTVPNIRKMFNFDKPFVRQYFRIASPVLMNETMWAVGFNCYVAIFARQGSENYAAFTVFDTIQQLAFVFFVGVCSACAIMVGKRIGEGHPLDAYNMSKRFLVITPMMGLVIGLIFIFLRKPLLSIMTLETAHAKEMASQLLLFYGLWLAPRMVPYTCIVGIFRAGGDTKTGFFYDVGIMFLWGIPIVWLMAYVVHAPFVAIVCSMYLAEDILKSFLCIRHFKSRAWIKQLTLPGSNAIEEQP